MSVVFALMTSLVSLEGATHTVKSGDTLYSIATRYKTTVSKLMSANGISDPRKLRVGQRLSLTAGSGSASSSTVQTSTEGRGKRVIIDPGHGGRDRGAVWGGVRESTLNYRVATKLETILKQRGYAVTMTRRSDAFVSLSHRAAIANRYRNAIFVSIHFNATRETWVRGAETYYAGAQGRSLAASIQREMVRRLNLRNRGVRLARFTVLMQTRCPAVLVECGFISNASERRRCVTSSYQSSAALAIAEGIKRYRWN